MDSQRVVESLCGVFRKANELCAKILSVEVFSNTLDLEELEKLPKSFCSLVWLYDGSDLTDLGNVEPFVTLEKLCLSNEHLLFHLPCRNLMEKDAFEILKTLKELNVRNLLVLQGDIVAERDKRDFEHAVDLVKYIRKTYGEYFTIGVAGYPDSHPDAPNAALDLMNLKEKVTAGSDFVVTQMFFDYNVFDEFYKNFKRVCPSTPLLVGVYIISSYESFSLARRLLKKDLPEDVTDFIMKNKDNQGAILDFGIQLCVGTIRRVLCNAGSQIVGIHFFSLNKFQLIQKVCDQLEFYEMRVERAPNMRPYSFFTRTDI